VARPVRSTFILALVTLATALAAVGGWQFARASAPVSGPIILISIEALRPDHLAAYGYRNGSTPTIDALAADGIVFEHAYAHAVQTLPSHASLLTGRLPFETGVRDDVGFPLNEDERPVAELLRERGFATGGVVSTFLLRPTTGISRGFDFYDASMPAGQIGLPLDRIERDGAISEAVAERWLEAQESSRVFLFLQLNEPHAPYDPPERFNALAPYDGEVAYADEIVGRLVHWLKTHQLYDRSTILLLSDHGEGLGDHGESQHGLFLYQEDIRVPFIIKPAGGTSAGRRVSGVVQLADVTPTILDLAKAPLPGTLRGWSLEPVMDGDPTVPDRDVYSEANYGHTFFGWNALASLTDRRRQYIRAPREELYDLESDPREERNLADDVALENRRKELDALAGHGPAPLANSRQEEGGPLFAAAYGVSRLQVPTLDSADTVDPKDAAVILERYRTAVDRAAERRWGPALDALDRILHTDPEQPNVLADVAAIAARAGQVDRAVAALDRLAELVPIDPGSLLDGAGLLLRAGRLDEARHHAETALERAGDDRRSAWRGHVLLADVALAEGDPPTARREAALADESDPGLPIIDLVEARLLVAQGEDASAAALLERAIDDVSDTEDRRLPGLHTLAGETLARLDLRDRAEAELVEALREFPEDRAARTALTKLYAAADSPARPEPHRTPERVGRTRSSGAGPAPG
jgi:choline-sulfatase